MKLYLIPILILLLPIISFGQTQPEMWDTYLASYENNMPGSVTLRMDLINSAPITSKPFVVITGPKYKTERADGFPTDFDVLYKIEDYIIEALKKDRDIIPAGTFTHNKERLQYIYIGDTVGVNAILENAYRKVAEGQDYYLNIRFDKDWEGYIKFLYPNKYIMNDMTNRKIVMSLIQEGDDLSQKREVDHWFYFSEKKNMQTCIKQLENKGFTIKKKGKHKNGNFQLIVQDDTYVKIDSINKITLELMQIANALEGNYDGWETQMIK
ncbi:DUF695 domain-containing protein [Flammeovirga sp. SJP92]|uniref:DUF695 domain-containing protein n=1 Tax=Flammeovirga sp. SJP92 TaxID=1775430 RepID=UPI0007883E66|nr:DUF695 domain-containing protein [Flammeovirga sp. SJP92]KXX70890.1 hypothetical protein AVL50_10990 [Flammeovirga sp. SJP92]